MEIEITRVDGGLKIKPAPPYITGYLAYSQRQMVTVRFKRQTKYVKQLLHTQDEEGNVYTLPGFFTALAKLIVGRGDSLKVIDLRSTMPAPDWAKIKAIGPRDYQVDPIVKFIAAGAQESGLMRCAGGWGGGLG